MPPTTPSSGTQLPPDLELYNQQARSWSASMPGNPTWGPYLTVQKAIEHEQQLICTNPTAEEWDRKADERLRLWEAGPFAESLRRLLRIPHHAKLEVDEP